MLMKTYITVLTLGVSCLAAPVPGCTTTTVDSRGLGYICTGSSASKRVAAPEPEPQDCTTTVDSRGLGYICTGSATSKRVAEESTEGSQALAKRTGMGIISSGTDDA